MLLVSSDWLEPSPKASGCVCSPEAWVGLRLTIRQPQGLRGALASPCLSPPSLESSGGAYMARGFLCVGICVQPAYTATATATAPPGRGVHSRGRKGCQTRRVSAACDSSSESGQDAAASERLRASNTCPDPMNPSPPQRYKERSPPKQGTPPVHCAVASCAPFIAAPVQPSTPRSAQTASFFVVLV